MGKPRETPAVSVHSTLNGQIEVNWEQLYEGEYRCVNCSSKRLRFSYSRNPTCRLAVECRSCRKTISLTCEIPRARRNHPTVSIHQVLKGTQYIDWSSDYQGEYHCPQCRIGHITNFYYSEKTLCRLALKCNNCSKVTNLTCKIPAYTFNYKQEISCPNPLCQEVGMHGQKGWVYRISNKVSYYRCRFCNISFNPDSKIKRSWAGSQQEDKLQPFVFAEHIWDLRHFYNEPYTKYLRFEDIQPSWYQYEVKRYLCYLLKARVYSSTSQIRAIRAVLAQLGQIVRQAKLQQPADIARDNVLAWIDSCHKKKAITLYGNLKLLKQFLDWLGLDANQLVKRSDLPKIRFNDPDWLDEPTRVAIREHLNKIPAPIARHYLVQEYTAARPGDVCRLAFNCLVEDEEKWYIQFFQEKVKRWHKIPANRTIRKIIEEQQQWIQETIGQNYNYLFCHFRSYKAASYPKFPSIKPLPEPPKTDTNCNPMVRVIRYLIERENILDVSGQRPHFTGRITRSSRLQEVRTKHGVEAAQLYADHKSSNITFQHYTPPTREQVAQTDLPFQALLLNPDNKFLPWQSLPETLLQNPKAHELDLEIAPRLTVYGHCTLNPKTPCPFSLFPKCYGCSNFRPSTGKLSLYERQYRGEEQRLAEAEQTGAELASEEAKATLEAMNQWLPELRRIADGQT